MEYFKLTDLKQYMDINDALNLYARLKRRRLGEYKMCTYSNSRCKSIIQSMLHFNLEECLNSSLSIKDKRLLQELFSE